MAENEILDVGNPRRYKQFRIALSDNRASDYEVAEALEADFKDALRKKLRGKPLDLVLKACDVGGNLLQSAVETLKDRHLAKIVERAYAASRSDNPSDVASTMADILIDGAVERAMRFARKQPSGIDGIRHASLEAIARSQLDACKPQIAAELEASLRNVSSRREPIRPRKTPQAVASTSLVQPK